MKQTPDLISLLEITGDDHPYGNVKGREAFHKLLAYVQERPTQKVFGVSLKGILHTDASFPRESVISLAKHFKGERWFFLCDLRSRDLLDNWSYAADAKEQPLIVLWEGKAELIGARLQGAAEKLARYVVSHGEVTTAKVAKDLGISVQNASTQLKRLSNQGVVMRDELAAETGGKEFIYRAAGF